MSKPLVIGFCGTAKNTGKTTTMKVVLDGIFEREKTVALTSIGYDGELVDHITGLPKPRIYAMAGTFVALCEKCARGSAADIEVLKKTNIQTALGPIVIGKVRKPGLILLAGPTKSVDIKKVNNILSEYGVDIILVDGALSRIAPMVDMDGIVMATGASRTNDIDQLVAQTAALARVYDIPEWIHDEEELNLFEKEGTVVRAGSLLDGEMAKEALDRVTDKTRAIVLDGFIGALGYKYLFSEGLDKLKGKRLVLADPMKILVAGSPTDLESWMKKLSDADVTTFVRKQVGLKLITINPFYPLYRFETHDYEAAYVDKEELKEKMQKMVSAPVVNVLDEKEEDIFHRIIG